MQVHHDAGTLVGASLVNPLALPGVNKLLGEAVSVFDVIPAATPKPVPGQVLGPRCSAAAAGGELALPAGTAHGVDHPGRAHCVGERRLPAACAERQAVLQENPCAPLPAHRQAGRAKALQKPPKLIHLLKRRVTLNHAPQIVFTPKKPKQKQSIRAHKLFVKSRSRFSFMLVKAWMREKVNWGRSTMPAGPKQPCLCVRGRKGNRLPVFQKKEMLNTTFKSLVLKLLLLKHDLCTSPTCTNLFKVIAFYKASWYQKKCAAE